MELKNPKADITDPPKQFTFDAAYDQESVQKDLYLETFAPLVNSVLEGFNGTIFAYGQTGKDVFKPCIGRKDAWRDKNWHFSFIVLCWNACQINHLQY